MTAATAESSSAKLLELAERLDAQQGYAEVVASLQAGHGAALGGVWGSSCALVAANLARHHVRDEGRRQAFVTAYAERPVSSFARPDETAERRELLGRLQEALEALPHDLRVGSDQRHR